LHGSSDGSPGAARRLLSDIRAEPADQNSRSGLPRSHLLGGPDRLLGLALLVRATAAHESILAAAHPGFYALSAPAGISGTTRSGVETPADAAVYGETPERTASHKRQNSNVQNETEAVLCAPAKTLVRTQAVKSGTVGRIRPKYADRVRPIDPTHTAEQRARI